MMKKFYTFLIALLFVGGAMGQNEGPCESCLPDGIQFNSQAEIDNFQTNFPGCSEIEGNVTIGQFLNNNIVNLSGLNILTSINGFLEIYRTNLSDLSGLENLTYIGKHLGIGKLKTGNPTIGAGNSISSLHGLENLTFVGDSIDIRYNGNLEDIDALSSLTTINGDLILVHNRKLSNLNGCSNIDSIKGSIIIQAADSLENLSGLDRLRLIDGDLQIGGYNFDQGLFKLKKLTGLDNIDSIMGDFIIANNSSLINLNGLDKLNKINGDLSIVRNDSIESLIGIEQLENISGELWLLGNQLLKDISSLNNLNPQSIEYLNITHNAYLSECHFKPICDYLSSPGANVEIYDNAFGCNSIQEAQDSCEAHAGIIDGLSIAEKLVIYPNPTHSTITIELPTQPSKNTNLTISNTNGQQLIVQRITKPQTKINISHLPVGIYIVKIWSDKDVMVQKIIKQ